jgi:phospholipase C
MTHRRVRSPYAVLYAFLAATALALGLGIGTGHTVNAAPPFPTHDQRDRLRHLVRHNVLPTPIQHVVVLVMENRTVDNLFATFPGADTGGLLFPSQALMAPDDPDHFYADFVSEYGGSWPANSEYTVDSTQNYVGSVLYGLAAKWLLADEMLQTNEGPSFAAHQYLVAGQSGGIDNFSSSYNTAPYAMADIPLSSGCADETGTGVPYVNTSATFPATETPGPACNDYDTILDHVNAAFGSSASPAWRYYIAAPTTFWDAPNYIHHLASQATIGIVSDGTGTAFARDVRNHALAPLTYIVPCGSWSDHPMPTAAPNAGEVGPNYVNFVVNTIGQSTYWPNTTVLITWDDWGGWYDHVHPPHWPNAYGNPLDPYEYGFRVPLVVVSGWLKSPGTVDHTGRIGSAGGTLRTQAAILRYVESVFNLSPLGTADGAAFTDNLQEAFDYTRASPIPFSAVPGPTPFPAPSGDCTHPGP